MFPEKIKFKCDLHGANFKKEIILKKHKNTKHNLTYCPNEKKIGEVTFDFTFDIRPDKKSEAKAMRPE